MPGDVRAHFAQLMTSSPDKNVCVLRRSTGEGWLVQAIVGSFIGFCVVLSWWWKTGGNFVVNRTTYFHLGITIFSVCFTAATLYQRAWPIHFTTTITPSAVLFQRSNRAKPDRTINRSDVIAIYRAYQPWYASKSNHLYTYAFELSDGGWYVINYRFVSAATKADFAREIERIWDWPPLQDAPHCSKLMSR